jgi:hypothetical protein
MGWPEELLELTDQPENRLNRAQERLLDSELSLMYPGTGIEHSIRKIGYMYRKRDFGALFCMGKRIDMRNTIQPNVPISTTLTYLGIFACFRSDLSTLVGSRIASPR